MGKNNRKRRSAKKRLKNKVKRIKNKKSRNEHDLIGPDLRIMENPFYKLSDEERNQAIEEIALNSDKIYQESLTKIQDLLKQYDPKTILSVLVSYGLTVGVGSNGIIAKNSDRKIEQYHVEICQALALQIKDEKLLREPMGPDVVENLWDMLVALMQAYNYKAIEVQKDSSENTNAIKLLQEMIRSNTQMVRNWGYFSQVKRISREIYSHFDSLIEGAYSFNVSKIIDLFQLLINESEKFVSSWVNLFSNLQKIKNKTDLIINYYKLTGQSSDAASEFIQSEIFDSFSVKSLFFMLMSHYDLRLYESFEFTPEYLSENLGIELHVVKNMIKEFSFEWGSLEFCETEHIYLSNPIWLHPIIKTEENKYLCVLPQMFFSFVFPSLERFIDESNKPEVSERRASYLENKIVEIINTRFPESNTVSGVKWKLDDVEYETDLITFIDSYAIIVEAKSGKISEPALRGAPDRLKRHINDILISPNVQSKRFKDKLVELISNPEIDDELRNKLPIDLSTIHKIVRVSVSLEDFGSIQSNIFSIKDTGWLPVNFESCPTMNLADFETLFDFLEHPVQLIHYLERRESLEREIGYFGDELDLMGLYIGTLFNLGDIDPDVDFIISDMSAPLDAYYNSKDVGIDISKPVPKLSHLFSSILNQLEQRKFYRWTEIGVILHMFSPDDQRKLTNMLNKLKSNVRKKWMVKGHKNIAVCIPPKASEYAICYVVYNDKNASSRDEYIEEAAKFGLEAEHVKQCLVIAKNMDKDDLSYHFIGLFK